MLDIKTKGGDSISFSFVAANFWENVNKGGKGRELMLTRGKKKQKTGERKKQERRRKGNKEQDSRKQRNLEAKRKAKKGNRNLKKQFRNSEKEKGQILIPFYQHLTRC